MEKSLIIQRLSNLKKSESQIIESFMLNASDVSDQGSIKNINRNYESLRVLQVNIRECFKNIILECSREIGSDNLKPPLGLRPRDIVIQERMDEIIAAVNRYRAVKKPIPEKWSNEYFDISSELMRLRDEWK